MKISKIFLLILKKKKKLDYPSYFFTIYLLIFHLIIELRLD